MRRPPEFADAYRDQRGKVAGQQALADSVLTLTGRARRGDPRQLALRFARDDAGDLWVDLGDVTGRAVKITATGWSVVDVPRVPFRLSALTGALPEPIRGGSLAELWGLVNVAPDSRPQVLAWLLFALDPGIPHQIAVLTGEQGTGKSATISPTACSRSSCADHRAPIRRRTDRAVEGGAPACPRCTTRPRRPGVAVLPSVHLADSPCMVDFARVLAAIDLVLGTDGLATYLRAGDDLAADAVTGDPSWPRSSSTSPPHHHHLGRDCRRAARSPRRRHRARQGLARQRTGDDRAGCAGVHPRCAGSAGPLRTSDAVVRTSSCGSGWAYHQAGDRRATTGDDGRGVFQGGKWPSSVFGLPVIARAVPGHLDPPGRRDVDDDDLLVGAAAMHPDPHGLSKQVGRDRPSRETIGMLAGMVRVTPNATVFGRSAIGCSSACAWASMWSGARRVTRWTRALTCAQDASHAGSSCANES